MYFITVVFQQKKGKCCCGAARPQFLLTSYCKRSNLQQQHSQYLKFTGAIAPLTIKIIYTYVNTAGIFSPPQLNKGSQGKHKVPPACMHADFEGGSQVRDGDADGDVQVVALWWTIVGCTLASLQ